MATLSIRRFGTWTLLAVAVLATAAAARAGDHDATDPKTAPAKTVAPKPAFVDEFKPDWEKAQTAWEVATWKQNKTQMDPERCRTDGKGRMAQTVLAGLPARGGSMQTTGEYPYGRWVARVKPSSVRGVLNSIFTMDWDDKKTADTKHDGSKFEVDIEFLTYTFRPKAAKVHFAVHVKGKHNAFVEDYKLDFNPSDDFHEWGFDILPDVIIWHLDGRELRRFNRPKGVEFHPNYEFFFNSWTSKKWIKGPGKTDATYLIDWVRFYPVDQMTPLAPPAEKNKKAAEDDDTNHTAEREAADDHDDHEHDD